MIPNKTYLNEPSNRNPVQVVRNQTILKTILGGKSVFNNVSKPKRFV